jgi:hypothetical protein
VQQCFKCCFSPFRSNFAKSKESINIYVQALKQRNFWSIRSINGLNVAIKFPLWIGSIGWWTLEWGSTRHACSSERYCLKVCTYIHVLHLNTLEFVTFKKQNTIQYLGRYTIETFQANVRQSRQPMLLQPLQLWRLSWCVS